jgi:hypothetical protein
MRKAVRLIAFRKGRYNNALELGIAPIAKVVLRHTPRSVCRAGILFYRMVRLWIYIIPSNRGMKRVDPANK